MSRHRATVDEGCASVMSSSNEMNGIPTNASHYIMSDVLRGQLVFKGFVLSDWSSIEQMMRFGYARDTKDYVMYIL